MYRSLLPPASSSGSTSPTPTAAWCGSTVDLQADFALNQPLSPFVLEAIAHLDPESETYALDVLSIVEAMLENPGVVHRRPARPAAGPRRSSELKREGVEYEERMAELDKLEHPKPLRDFTYDLFDAVPAEHPWVGDHTIRPKSVARDLYERAMTFADYVGHYGLARSEGLLLRYLTDAYKGLVQNVPEDAKTDELLDLTEWLGELVRQVDSSLLDEWEALRHPDVDDAAGRRPRPPLADDGAAARRVTANHRAFRVMVRNELFRWVELLARRAYADLADRLPGTAWTAEALAAAMAPYWERARRGRHRGDGARGRPVPGRRGGRTEWTVRQALDDPAGDHDWAIAARVDLEASDEEGRAVVVLDGISAG